MKIDREEARRVAALAHLEFTEEQLDAMAAEMTEILGYIDQLKEVAIAAGGSGSSLAATPLRDDVPQPSLEREKVAANAPVWSDGFFVVPKVIGD
jgi:aspartyl-tRNA(Asn)/glutamyl-tRNA(Gln) amidotransferase subunit C